MYAKRKAIEALQSTLTSSKHEGPDNFFIVDTGANGNLINDKRLIVDPSAHRPLRIRVRTGTGECFTESIGPISYVVTDHVGKKITISRERPCTAPISR